MDASGRPSQQIINAQKELARRRKLAGVTYKPPAVRNAAFGLRNDVPSSTSSVSSEHSSLRRSPIPHAELRTPRSVPRSQLLVLPSQLSVRLSPTLAAYCLDKNHRHQGAALDGPYRLYKILQTVDQNGRGWLANTWVEALLTRKESPFAIYGRRQLKIMLRRGEGLFWQRVKSKGEMRIRLISRAKLVEALLSGSRLRGREVTMPIVYLLGRGRGRQAAVNAALYAAVHAGRLRYDQGPRGEKKPRPISRAALKKLAGCSRYRQRSYEKRMKISVQRNVHILGEHSDYKLARARQHFRLPAYKHIDFKGTINRHRRGASYIAVRLPNSYQIPDNIVTMQSRRQRTINRSLDGLCHMGSGGSGKEKIVRRYHRCASSAVRASQRAPHTPTYWPLSHKGSAHLWQTLMRASSAEAHPGPLRSQQRPYGGLPTAQSKGGDLD